MAKERRMSYAQALFAVYLLAVAIVPGDVAYELSPTLPIFSFHRLLLLANCGVFAWRLANKHATVQMGNSLDKAFLLYLVAIVPCVLFSFDRISSLKYFFSEVVLLGIIVAYLSFHWVRDEQDARRLFSWIVFVGSLAALIGLGEALLGYDYKQQELFRQFYMLDESRILSGVLHYRSSLFGSIGSVRVESNFSHPIEFGSFLALMFPLIWAKLSSLKGEDRLIPILQIGILLGALFYASVRGPWLIVLMVMLLGFRKNWGILLAIVSLIFYIIVPYWSDMLFGRGVSMLDFRFTDITRLYAIQNNLEMLAKYPLFGVGLGQVDFGEIYGAWDHYLTMRLRGTGLIGTFAWLWVWATYFRVVRPWDRRYSLATSGWIVKGVSVAILGALVMSSLQNSAFEFKQTNVFLMALMGVALKLSHIIKVLPKRDNKPNVGTATWHHV